MLHALLERKSKRKRERESKRQKERERKRNRKQPRIKQPRPETNVAGTAIPDSGNGKRKIARRSLIHAFSRFGGAAAPQQATKTRSQRSRNSYVSFILTAAELSRIAGQMHP